MTLQNQHFTASQEESRRDSERLSSPSVESSPSDVPASPAPLPSTPAAVIGSYAGCGGSLPSLEVAVSHACDACGGSGREPRQIPWPGIPNYRKPVPPAVCPVCQGAGRISDVIPAKDALADAETLRGFWHELAQETGVEARFHLTQQTTARLWQNGMLGHYLPWECADSTRDAARAAFRAVPGLRV